MNSKIKKKNATSLAKKVTERKKKEESVAVEK